MDRIEEISAPSESSGLNRRSLLRTLGGGAVASFAAWSLAGCGGDDNNSGNNNGGGGGGTTPFTRDVDILNFALHLEYLEAEFYTYATTGQGIESQSIQTNGGNGFAGGSANAGTTSGTFQTNFGSNTRLRDIALELATDERLHVAYLRNVITSLGGTPIAKPNINLAALPNVDLTTVNGFLTAARL